MPRESAPFLVETPEGLALTDGNLAVRGDFAKLTGRASSDAVHRELVVRAAKVKGTSDGSPPVAVDATAGLGEDSFLLAAAGFQVTLYERNPLIAALLRDALRRALADERTAAIVSRMRLVEGDSTEALLEAKESPDVVLLDPMFPQRTKSAAVKKKLQLLQQLEGPCIDEGLLLGAAQAAHPRKIVIKRPVHGPFLADVKPSYSLRGKAVRFDVIVQAPGSRAVTA